MNLMQQTRHKASSESAKIKLLLLLVISNQKRERPSTQ